MRFKLLFYAFCLVSFMGSANTESFGITISIESLHIATPKPHKHADISVGGMRLFGLTPESEISISGFNAVSQLSPTSFLKFHTTVNYTEVLVLVQFKHYTLFYNNCLIASRKSDPIFPSHYFW